MKTKFFIFLLAPFFLFAQETTEYAVFQNTMFTASPDAVVNFESGLAEHNKKYHANAITGVRVYWIANGDNSGKYMLSAGAKPWSAFDNVKPIEGHDEHWTSSVLPFSEPGYKNTFWRFRSGLSNFPKDFTIDKLKVDIYDVKRGHMHNAIKLMVKVKQVMVEKYPEEAFGCYTNEFSNTIEAKDLAIVSFFGNASWLGEDSKFKEKYEEIFGENSFEEFWNDWKDITNGLTSSEIWLFREDLSGVNGEVKAATRE